METGAKAEFWKYFESVRVGLRSESMRKHRILGIILMRALSVGLSWGLSYDGWAVSPDEDELMLIDLPESEQLQELLPFKPARRLSFSEDEKDSSFQKKRRVQHDEPSAGSFQRIHVPQSVIHKKHPWQEKVLQIENLYQTRSFADRCEQLTCEGEDLIQLVSLVEQYRTQIVSNIYYRKGQTVPELNRLAPCDFQRIVNPASGGLEEFVVYPCDFYFAKGSSKNVSLAFDYLTLKRKVKITPHAAQNPETGLQMLQKLKAEALTVKIFSGHNGLLQAYDESVDMYPFFLYVLTQDFYQGTLMEFNNQLLSSRHYQISQDLLEGLTYLHANHLIHRDIRPANILIRRDGHNVLRAALADYGLMVPDHQSPQMTLIPWECLPPEATNYAIEVQNKSFDIWALGLSLLEMRQKFSVMKRCVECFDPLSILSNPLHFPTMQDLYAYFGAKLHAAIQPDSGIEAVDSFYKLNETQACSRKEAVRAWISQCAESTERNPLILTTLDEMICTMLIPNAQCRIQAPEALVAIQTICSKNPQDCN